MLFKTRLELQVFVLCQLLFALLFWLHLTDINYQAINRGLMFFLDGVSAIFISWGCWTAFAATIVLVLGMYRAQKLWLIALLSYATNAAIGATQNLLLAFAQPTIGILFEGLGLYLLLFFPSCLLGYLVGKGLATIAVRLGILGINEESPQS